MATIRVSDYFFVPVKNKEISCDSQSIIWIQRENLDLNKPMKESNVLSALKCINIIWSFVVIRCLIVPQF